MLSLFRNYKYYFLKKLQILFIYVFNFTYGKQLTNVLRIFNLFVTVRPSLDCYSDDFVPNTNDTTICCQILILFCILCAILVRFLY